MISLLNRWIPTYSAAAANVTLDIAHVSTSVYGKA